MAATAEQIKKIFGFQTLNFEVPDESYSRNVSCALNLISTFLLT